MNTPLDEIQPPELAPIELRQETIFATEILSADVRNGNAPLILVGLPRSGSSFLSDLISQSGYYYVFDDLYLQRRAENLGVSKTVTSEQFEKLLFFLGWQIRARIRFKNYAVPKMLQDDVEPMNSALREAYGDDLPEWYNLQKEWLTRLALLNGCTHWGYNLPGAFLSIDKLQQYYPDANFLFLFRSPERVLASYKHITKDNQDGDPRQYHPLVYSLYWKKSVSVYQALKTQFPDNVTYVTFEDIIADPVQKLQDIGLFFGFESKNIVKSAGANSSFSGKRKSLNGLEISLLKVIAGKEIKELDYEIPNEDIKLSDFLDLIKTTTDFSIYQILRALKNRSITKRVLTLFQSKGTKPQNMSG